MCICCKICERTAANHRLIWAVGFESNNGHGKTKYFLFFKRRKMKTKIFVFRKTETKIIISGKMVTGIFHINFVTVANWEGLSIVLYVILCNFTYQRIIISPSLSSFSFVKQKGHFVKFAAFFKMPFFKG